MNCFHIKRLWLENQKHFTVICNIMGPLKQCGEIAAISRYCLIVLLWIAFSKNIAHVNKNTFCIKQEYNITFLDNL